MNQPITPTSRSKPPEVIAPGTFVPSSKTKSKKSPLTGKVLLLLIAGLVAVLVLGFLFTARSVSFQFSPANAEFKLDGLLKFELGGTYLVFPGSYQLQASAPGYEDLQQQIQIAGERNQYIEIALVELPGRINLITSPAGATALIDGEEVGVTPLSQLQLPRGDYSLMLRRTDYEDHQLVLNVEGLGKEQSPEIELLPDWADVEITTEPAGAVVSIGGKLTELTTPATVPVPSGFQELTLKLEGYKSWTTDIEVMAREPQTLPPVILTPADGLVTVITNPPGAGVTANGKFFGESPAELALRPGKNYKVQVYKAGYGQVSRTLTATKGERTLNLSLKALLGKVAVEVEPQDAVLTVDGRALSSSNQTLTLPVGEHTFTVSKPGYASYKTTLRPKDGLTQQLKVKLLTVAAARLAALKPKRTSAAGDELLLFKEGALTMGASRREPGRRANEVLRPVTLTRPFYVATKEVTNKQFKAFINGHDSGEFEDSTLAKPDMPVVQVRWTDAAMYCNWLSKKDNLEPFYQSKPGEITGINPTADGYRLPTEAEWAFVARSQPKTDALLRFPWGPRIPPQDRHGNYADRSATHVVGRIIFGYNDNHIVAAPVGTFEPNANGLYDIGGNVAEWISDFYAQPTTEPTTDPQGPTTGDYHVIRGSSWRHGTISELRLSFRDYGKDGRKDLGFRIARYAE